MSYYIYIYIYTYTILTIIINNIIIIVVVILFEGVKALEVVLEPGDCLYLPQCWWHQVSSGAGDNVSLNFWRSEKGGSAPEGGRHSTISVNPQ